MSDDRDHVTVSRKGGKTFALVASAIVVALIAAGVAYTTGDWGREATRTGNDGAGLHIPAPTPSTNQPPAPGAIPR